MLYSTAMTVNNLRTLLQEPGPTKFIDLRDPDEFEAEHVEGFANVPLANLFDWIKEQDKSALLVLFCTNGKRANIALDVLKNAGFSNIRTVAGGMLSWKVHSFPIARAKHTRTR